MLTLLDQLDKGTLWRSPGGIHPPEVKFLSNATPISQLPLAATYLVPIPQVGENCTLAVNIGDSVLKGTPLTQGTSIWHLPVHAPTSGTIVAIEPRASNHASALPVNTCVIQADGKDTWCELVQNELDDLNHQQMIDKIRAAGIAGMGGAAFPTHIKLNPVSEIDLVIINGVECEPYISADDRLMREYSQDILAGIGIIHRLLTPKRIVIAIEDNKPEAAKAMQAAVVQCGLPADSIRVTVIPTKYPSGGEKQLIQIITGREVPSGAIPAKLGIVVHNVGTAFAIHQAITQGKPLIERVVTVTGKNVGKPGNYWLPIGTPVEHVLSATEFMPEPEQKVIIGGPMMGHALANIQVPILKGTNCILVPSSQEIGTTPEEKACIRCAECANACPALLLPQQLFWHAKAEEYDKAASYNLKDCIECGCCSYVCPSDIPLVEYYRIAKSALKQAADEKQQAERAKQRFDARLARLEEEKLAREAKAKEAAERRQATMTGTDKNAVAEAMARIAAKKAAAAQSVTGESITEESSATTTDTTEVPKGKAAVAAAIARAKAKKSAQANADGTDTNGAETDSAKTDNAVNVDANDSISATDAIAQEAPLSQKDKVAAAIARAKAKKAAQQAEPAPLETADSTPEASAADDKKAKVAAAVARAKAKKAALQAETAASDIEVSNTDVSVSDVSVSDVNDSEAIKKAKVAAAVARAKAKKAAQQVETNADNDLTQTVAPAVDSAASVQADVNDDTEAAATDVNDAEAIKKAKVAAAVARAKAKKIAAASAAESEIESVDDIQTKANVASPSIAAAKPEAVLLSAEPIETAALSGDELKKARIAATIAKAKAKKAALAQQTEASSDSNVAND
ncbi:MULTISPECIES: electron transport complex subunit RsxC [unclassified Shewanella]|uniref:electron transport complex subunit RsxC n=1 Tax=Shewanella TaxID=22 RepID=UPI0021D81596|nr:MULTISPECIES: electron transport complex subunit RsxC [unclassified Shewanella]MCU8020069.1 electron transport complex subunit RsxC [Shewanella sp. SM78]MCU8041579.1 electron transport complex subunit RsxC [Shewanella sp. SM68]MCU8046443.1 electron transport complex subunit RsxC [Shewanella sp. SM65]MCU8077397.1 electron transport complex subunit RsxC [Shewanella sp. SM103]